LKAESLSKNMPQKNNLTPCFGQKIGTAGAKTLL